MKKIKKIDKIIGDVPLFYKPSTIYTMCILINALVDEVNELNKRVEMLMQANLTEKGGD
jgi:hypothetical protein